MTIISPGTGAENFGASCPPQLLVEGQVDPDFAIQEVGHELDVPELPGLLKTQAPVEVSDIEHRSYVPLHAKPHESLGERTSKTWKAAKLAGKTAVAVTLLSPANEVIRGAVITAGAFYSRSPEMTALTAGGSTLVVEMVGGLAAASVMETGASQRFTRFLHRKLPTSITEQKLSPITKGAVVLASGTVVGMAIEQIEDPERTKADNQRYAVRTSLGLGAALGAAGAAGTSVISTAVENPTVSVSAAGGLVVLETARRLMHKRRPKSAEAAVEKAWEDADKFARYRVVTDPEELEKVALIEQAVWDEKAYGNLDEEGYAEHIQKSRTFGAFDEDGNCVGETRMFRAEGDTIPPFFDLKFDDEEQRTMLIEHAQAGQLEELGTTAVIAELRGKGVNTHMWRLAYRDAVARGIKEWGIIMEPERVQHMNEKYGFTFKQLGSTTNYQGGECAAFVVSFDEMLKNMRRHKPHVYYWFTRKSLKH